VAVVVVDVGVLPALRFWFDGEEGLACRRMLPRLLDARLARRARAGDNKTMPVVHGNSLELLHSIKTGRS
jgi:hypothetical protein